jgi:hypothetical protein
MVRWHPFLLSATLLVSCSSCLASERAWVVREDSFEADDQTLVNDPTKVEYLAFGKAGDKRIVLTTWGQAWTDARGDSHRVTTNPALEWKFTKNHVVIYEDRDVAEVFSFVRREGHFLLLRMKSGHIGRFKILDEPH